LAPQKSTEPERRERSLFAEQRENSLLILDDGVQGALILQDGGLVLLDRLLIRFDFTLIGDDRLLIPQNAFLICDDVFFGHL
jgi:hypothetical protein